MLQPIRSDDELVAFHQTISGPFCFLASFRTGGMAYCESQPDGHVKTLRRLFSLDELRQIWDDVNRPSKGTLQ